MAKRPSLGLVESDAKRLAQENASEPLDENGDGAALVTKIAYTNPIKHHSPLSCVLCDKVFGADEVLYLCRICHRHPCHPECFIEWLALQPVPSIAKGDSRYTGGPRPMCEHCYFYLDTTVVNFMRHQRHEIAQLNQSIAALTSRFDRWRQTVVTALPASLQLRLFVKTLLGAIHNITTHPFDSVAHLKELVQDQTNTPPDQQRLIFAGSQLEDDKLLTDYKITDQSTLFLTLRLRGD